MDKKKMANASMLDIDNLPDIGKQFSRHKEAYVRRLNGESWVDIAKDFGITAPAVRELSHRYEVKVRRMIQGGVCPLCGNEVHKNARSH